MSWCTVQKLPHRKAGWSWGHVSAIDSEGRTIWIADAHRDDGKRFVVRADEKLTAFTEFELSTRALPRLRLTSRRNFFQPDGYENSNTVNSHNSFARVPCV